MANEIKNGPKAEGVERIFLPGEMEWDRRDAALKAGEIEITDAMAQSYMTLSKEMGIALEITK